MAVNQAITIPDTDPETSSGALWLIFSGRIGAFQYRRAKEDAVHVLRQAKGVYKHIEAEWDEGDEANRIGPHWEITVAMQIREKDLEMSDRPDLVDVEIVIGAKVACQQTIRRLKRVEPGEIISLQPKQFKNGSFMNVSVFREGSWLEIRAENGELQEGTTPEERYAGALRMLHVLPGYQGPAIEHDVDGPHREIREAVETRREVQKAKDRSAFGHEPSRWPDVANIQAEAPETFKTSTRGALLRRGCPDELESFLPRAIMNAYGIRDSKAGWQLVGEFAINAPDQAWGLALGEANKLRLGDEYDPFAE